MARIRCRYDFSRVCRVSRDTEIYTQNGTCRYESNTRPLEFGVVRVRFVRYRIRPPIWIQTSKVYADLTNT